MNSKNLGKALKHKLDDWVSHVKDDHIKRVIRKNAIVTGGALVSLLTNEPVNDYDIYFKTLESCREVARYYIAEWNLTHDTPIHLDPTATDRVRLIIGNVKTDANGNVTNGRGNGAIGDGSGIDDDTEPYTSENLDSPTEPNPTISKPKYRPRFFTTNALSLSDGIQIVIRFCGPVNTIHENFDFEHTKCSYDYANGNVNLPTKSLECIINKELLYRGSKYPLTSIIRTRKFISRGWTISAGQYVKMAFELNDLNLRDIEVFKDQVVGVDSAYFMAALSVIDNRMKTDPNFELTQGYLFEIIDRIF